MNLVDLIDTWIVEEKLPLKKVNGDFPHRIWQYNMPYMKQGSYVVFVSGDDIWIKNIEKTGFGIRLDPTTPTFFADLKKLINEAIEMENQLDKLVKRPDFRKLVKDQNAS